MLAKIDPRLRRRIAIVAGAAAWPLFVAAVALDPTRVNEGVVLAPPIWAILYVASSTYSDPRRRKFVFAGAGLGAYYGAIAAGLLLGALVPAGAVSGGAVLGIGITAYLLLMVGAFVWPSKPVVVTQRRHFSWLGFVGLGLGFAAAFVVSIDGPGPLLAVGLLVVAAILVFWTVVTAHDEPVADATAS
jgi:MFS family permease